MLPTLAARLLHFRYDQSWTIDLLNDLGSNTHMHSFHDLALGFLLKTQSSLSFQRQTGSADRVAMH